MAEGGGMYELALLLSVARAMAISLALTLLLEGLIALVWGVKGRRDWLLLLGANCLTNPMVWIVHWGAGGGWVVTAALELCAVGAEWLIYRQWGRTIRPALLFSLCANGFSYCAGLLLQALL